MKIIWRRRETIAKTEMKKRIRQNRRDKWQRTGDEYD